MRLSLVILAGLIGLAAQTAAQPAAPGLEKYAMLLGNWQGEGTGQPGQGGGTFSFSYDLDRNVIVRRSHSEYPAAQDKPAIIHDDLMVIYPDTAGAPDRAVYFDNEGHVIRYGIGFAGPDTIVFTGERTAHAPLFRLSYGRIDPHTVNVRFEVSMDGVTFTTYVEGRSKRVSKFKH